MLIKYERWTRSCQSKVMPAKLNLKMNDNIVCDGVKEPTSIFTRCFQYLFFQSISMKFLYWLILGKLVSLQRTKIIPTLGFWTQSRLKALKRAEVRASRKWSRLSRRNRMQNSLRTLIHSEFKKFCSCSLDSTEVLARLIQEKDMERRGFNATENSSFHNMQKEYLGNNFYQF